MNFLSSEINEYFNTHHEKLLKFYPGLKIERLSSEIDNYIAMNGNCDQQVALNYFIQNLNNGKPLEYISRSCFFYKSNYFINDNVLIPRSESEILVSMAVEYSLKYRPQNVLEIGVGSGALILSYLMDIDYSLEQVVCSDISNKAIDVSRRNFFLHQNRLNLKNEVEFICCDKFLNIKGKFDLIISNPPYIMEKSDLGGVHLKVKEYEPHIALFIKDDEYNKWFDDFFLGLKKHLNKNGLCIMEGHEKHLKKLKNKFQKEFKIEIVKDYTNRDRFIRINNG